MVTQKKYYKNFVVETTMTPTPVLAYYLASVDSLYADAAGKFFVEKLPSPKAGSFDVFYSEYETNLSNLYPELFSDSSEHINSLEVVKNHCRDFYLKFTREEIKAEKKLENKTPIQDCIMLKFEEQHALGRMNLSQMKVQLRQFYMDGYTIGTGETLLSAVRDKCGKNTEKADKYFGQIQSYIDWLETKYVLPKTKRF